MKIVIDARESGTSTGRYVDKLIEYLAKMESEFEFIAITMPSRIDFLKKAAPNFKIVTTDAKEFTFAEQIKFLRQISQLKPDLVHFTAAQQPILYRGKVVTTFHDLTTARFRNPSKNQLVYLFKQQVYKWLVKRVAKKSAYLITPSQFVKRDVAEYCKVSSNKIFVTYEAADRIKDAPQPIKSLVGQKFIMYVGRPLPHKNLKRLMEAYSIIRNLRDNLQLVLVGHEDKLYKRHARWAAKEQIQGVVFSGFVSEGQLKWLYEHTAAYVFPSLSEGFGLPGLEAMVHGAPVITSRATCLPEIYGPAAKYFNPYSTRNMVRVIGDTLENPKLLAELKHRGLARAQKYSWSRMAKQTLDVYKKALEETGHRK